MPFKEKYKKSIPVDSRELNELLHSKEYDPIWIMTLNSKWSIAYLIRSLVFAGFIIYFFSTLINILISIIIILPYFIVAYISNTMRYTILPKMIIFEWGFFKSKRVVIPFEDITAINLVSYDDSDKSTIYFGTKSNYKIKKLNYDTNEPRAHITFENVKNGDKVYELLKMLWENSK